LARLLKPVLSTANTLRENIVNEYTAFLPGEQQALSQKIEVTRIVMQYQTVEASVGGEQKTLKVGESIQGWKLLAILPWHNGMPTAVFEKHVTHQGALVFVNAGRELARVPKQIGDLSKIKPREIISPPGMKFERPPELTPGPDQLGRYILDSDQDPCYENVAALGAEYTGWTLVSDDGVGAPKSTTKLVQVGTSSHGRATDAQISDGVMDRYWNGTAAEFYSAVLGLWERWTTFFDSRMQVEIPDPWLLQAAKAGIVAARCSYRGLEPSYQIGEDSYTKIPERSHALFPVAHYEFVWAQQLWNQTEQVEPYFQHYLDQYVLPDGNFTYNTQDQVEAPLKRRGFLAKFRSSLRLRR
jgi:hypothetical protein